MSEVANTCARAATPAVLRHPWPAPATAETRTARCFYHSAVWLAIRSWLVWSWQRAPTASHGVRSFCATRINPRRGATLRDVPSGRCCTASYPRILTHYYGLRASRTNPASACQSMSSRSFVTTYVAESHVTVSRALRATLAAVRCFSRFPVNVVVAAVAARRAVCATPRPSLSIESFLTYR